MFTKSKVMLSKEKIILNLLIIFIILSNGMEIYFIVSNVPKEIAVNGEEIIAVFSRFSKFILSLSSILAMILMIYPLFSLKKIIYSIDNDEVFNNRNINRLKRSALSMGGYVLLNIFNLINSGGKLSILLAENSTVLYGVNSKLPEVSIFKLGITFNMEIIYFISIIVFITILIQVIKIGKNIKEENDLTI
ncbi:DUF2975 domain-containing protein [Clostridium paraputrificum]|uniref:DUF2975 domain-containing protein n=1 Tax=Clostridium TaxID=1485 RepID=UPI00164D8249|nr:MULTISPECIES: DUF2975 domain-containing protein [Clostridium]MDB2088347.1 DUF2975 domain-containing protein [Clostridium paraputrificum]MDB2092033.1 DUF2975 domain-containing protein [Clostridium paraputrificum]MDU1181171.1 DUF2975 domain-containing protein [Clostridium sp.]MDU1228302.1 DUF2975 domain-containing protein [Clostridium sp.]MDU4318294.1 DUF2975 domain-containing protein [Clostridium sp.]